MNRVEVLMRRVLAGVVLGTVLLTSAGCDMIVAKQATPTAAPTLPTGSSAGAAATQAATAVATQAAAGTPVANGIPPLSGTPTIVASGLQYIDQTVGTGATATAGKIVSVHYTGWLTNGTKFDSSVDRGQPFAFPLGGGRVIAGWDQGVAGMKVGGKRRLIIPPALGYGAQANGPIPANSTLVFDVELLGVQ